MARHELAHRGTCSEGDHAYFIGIQQWMSPDVAALPEIGSGVVGKAVLMTERKACCTSGESKHEICMHIADLG